MATVSFQSVLMASRPKTLVAGLAPIAVATSLVHLNGFPVIGWVSLLALLCTLCLQVATNLFNDAIDFKKGADGIDRLGPQRVTASGLISENKVFILAGVFLLLAIATGAPLVLRGGIEFLALGFASLVLAYAYTGGPFPLAYLGLGELFVILFFGLVAVGGTYFLHTGYLRVDALVLGLQQGLLASVLIVVNNARDIDSDRRAGKMTLAARFGLSFAKFEVVFLYLVAFLLNLHWLFSGHFWLPVLTSVSVLMALVVVFQLIPEKPSEKYNLILARAGLAQLTFSVQFCLGAFVESMA